ncbi:MAG: tetratricopeptide repeat protein [Bacteroidia bacterium]|nr:tetratricopeptide repeat protein [Bacteroidia bacterium]
MKRLFICLTLLALTPLKAQKQPCTSFDAGLNKMLLLEYEAAIQLFDQCLNENPKSGIVFFQRGTCYLSMNKPNIALVDFNQAILLDTFLYDTYFNRALAHQALGNFTFSESDFLLYASRKPKEFKVYKNLALLMETMGDYMGAVNYYKKYLEFAPNDISILKSKALANAESGLYTSAIDDINQCFKINPNDTSLWMLKGNIYFDAQKFGLAIDAYNNVLLNSPGNREARLNRADAMISNRQYEEAITEYKRLLIAESNNPEYYFNVAFCALQIGSNQSAIENFSTALKYNYENIGLLLLYRGVAYNNDQKVLEACDDWKKSLEAGCKEAKSYIDNYCQ